MFTNLIADAGRAPLPEHLSWRVERIFIAQRFPGYTKTEIDNLTFREVLEIRHILRAQDEVAKRNRENRK